MKCYTIDGNCYIIHTFFQFYAILSDYSLISKLTPQSKMKQMEIFFLVKLFAGLTLADGTNKENF